ncbi:MAG: molybdopterin cofactor-binding domain-containing protein [Pseudomonadota bacterium]|nr:molybdopterin cofactor-binding domain-containing protein [Pseudomonadota bacterium]
MATRNKDIQQKTEELITVEESKAPAQQPLAIPTDNPVAYPLELPQGEARLRTPAVGQRARRPDGRLHGLGQTQYIDDITFPHMLHAKILRSKYPHARIVSIDTSEAEKMPGVMATLTGAEIPENSFGPTYQDQPVLAYPIARHCGDGVAAVAATSEQLATEALEKIKVEYEPLPAVFDPLEALEKDSPKVHGGDTNIYTSKVIKKGDVEKALKESEHVFHRQFRTQMVEHVPLEPHASIASWDGNGRVTLWTSLGRITLGREDLSRTLKMPQSKIRLIGTVVGGNFGGKNEITTEPVLALLSKKSRRPVKLVFTRGDEFISSTIRHPFVMDYTTGVNNDGKILARKIRLVLDGGSYCSWTGTTIGKGSILAPGPYDIENILVEAFAVYTNKTTTGAMRGFGAPQVCFAYESQMDDIAHKLGLDPLEIRLRNGFSENSLSPTSQTLQSVALKESLAQAAERFGWKERQS